MPTPEYQRSLDFLLGRINYERVPHMPYLKSELRLARMQQLLDLIGNPERNLPCIHVAGTKGKGSTCAMLDAILRREGYRVGLFTSPHLYRVEERFCVDGHICSEEDFVDMVRPIRVAVQQMDREPLNKPTYFEITTAIAFLYFSERLVDLAILEVGMGGRLDSTNVCQPMISVITSISFDHTRQLGHTLEKIAYEKAGIVKPQIPVVSGASGDGVRNVIQRAAHEKHSPLYELGRHFDVRPLDPDNRRFDYLGLGPHFSNLHDVEMNLLGRHQISNASLAISVCQLIHGNELHVSDAAIRSGLRNVICQARIEKVADQPLTYLDSAHNVASVQALLDVMEPKMVNRKRVLIFATTIGKDIAGMLANLLPRFDHIILTRYQSNPRGVEPSHIRKISQNLRQTSDLKIVEQPEIAWRYGLQLAGNEGVICITGSFFIAAEFREFLCVDAETNGSLVRE